jgi:hypothetical protein
VSTFDDGTELEFFEEPETLESPGRQRRRMRPRPGGPRRPAPPPPGAVALARLAGFVALAIAVVLGLVFWVGSCQGQSRHDEYASYMDSVRTIAQSSAATGTAALAAELNSPKLTLAELQAKLGQWSVQQQRDYDDALRLRPPALLQSAHQQVLATLQLRAIALTRLANILADAGSKSASQVANLLVKQARLLTASDLVWVELFKLPATDTLRRLGIKGVSAPASQIVGNPVVITFNSFKTVYQDLHATTAGGTVTGVHGSELISTEAVTGGKATPLTASASSPTTVNVAADLVFKVSFKDSGNFREVHIPVTLTVSGFGHNVQQKKFVQSIEKGQTETVIFKNLQLPTGAFAATSATVHIEIGKVPGEKVLSNNSASYPVFFSLPSGG